MSNPTGFRAMTPGINNAHTLAEQWGTQTAVQKKRAVLAFNKASSLLGLHAQAIQLMNCLLSFTRDCDWEADSRPLAWPDNQRLMDELNTSLATVKRTLRRLAETGLIAFKDSPSGRRVGRRNPHSGRIEVERSYGIDLAPLGIRTPDLEAIAEAQERRQAYTRSLAQQFTRDRKMLTSYIESGLAYDLPGPWGECADELDELAAIRRGRCSTERLESLCERLADVLERARTAYAAAADKFEDQAARPAPSGAGQAGQKDMNMSPLGFTSEPHIQNTTERQIHDLYRGGRSSANAEQLDLISAGSAGEEGLGNKPERGETPEQPTKIEARPIDPPTLMVLCPEFGQWIVSRGRVTWDDIVNAAEKVAKPSLQIPDSTWAAACRMLGRQTAAAAVALIYEKHEDGLIDNPGAYLNGMLSKAEAGQLHLPASLFHWRKPRKERRAPSTPTYRN
ncbi:plasmid replication protein RepC [Sinorhizobium meliloti]|uniref:plasmid replication protein RepC n=1 Tax=Rhizobium meliloti TaxID=382 RepID=UPI0030A78D6D